MEALRRAAVRRIAEQTKGLEAEQVEKIALHGVAIPPDSLATFTNLTQLTLVAMKPAMKSLASLLSIQPWKHLQLLELSDNAIAVPEALPSVYPSLRRLMLTNNKIESMEEISHLAAAFPALEVLDVSFNEVSTEDNFNSIFSQFPALVALDSRQKDGEEVVVPDIDESESEEDVEEESSEESSTEEEQEDDEDGDEPVAKMRKIEQD